MGVIFESGNGPSKVLEPTHGPFNFPSLPVSAEFSPVLSWRLVASSLMWRDEFRSAFLQPSAKRIAVGRLVVDQATDSSSQNAFVQQVFDQTDVVSAGGRDGATQGKTVAVGEQHCLRSLAALGLANVFTPFFAAENVASAIDSSWLIWPRRSNLRSSRPCTRSQMPDSVHFLCRRQQVDPDGNLFGISDHRAPVRRIQRIPSKQSRAGAGGRPPFGLGLGSGKISDIKFHWSSVSCKSGSILAPVPASAEASRVRFGISGLLSNRFYETMTHNDQLAN
jgi:hypothetical protein